MRKTIAVVMAAAFILCFAPPVMAQGQKNLFQTAIDAGSFTKLTGTAKAVNLDTILITGGPYTVLAPTDDAFNKLPAGTMDSLMKDKPKLTGVVKNHIISGKYTADELVKMGTVGTFDGQRLKVTKNSDGSISVDGAKIIKPDVQSSNGMIQGIDKVLVPK